MALLSINVDVNVNLNRKINGFSLNLQNLTPKLCCFHVEPLPHTEENCIFLFFWECFMYCSRIKYGIEMTRRKRDYTVRRNGMNLK